MKSDKSSASGCSTVGNEVPLAPLTSRVKSARERKLPEISRVNKYLIPAANESQSFARETTCTLSIEKKGISKKDKRTSFVSSKERRRVARFDLDPTSRVKSIRVNFYFIFTANFSLRSLSANVSNFSAIFSLYRSL